VLRWLERKVYVPVVSDERSRQDKWNDEDYLRIVKAFKNNKVFMSEVTHALALLREQADACQSVSELKGINRGIQAVKALMTAPDRAGAQLQAMRGDYE